MRYFPLIFLLTPFICIAQDTIIHKSSNKEADNIPSKFIISINAGLNLPKGDYGTPQTYSVSDGPNGEFYGFSADGFHIDLNGVYLLSSNFGLEGRFGLDENGYNNFRLQYFINKISQYQIGFYFAINPDESKFNLSFIGLFGLATASIPGANSYSNYTSFNSISETVLPGIGNGFAFYGGIVLTFKIYKKLYFDLLTGYLATSIDFPNSTTTTYTSTFIPYPNGTTTKSSTNSDIKMNTGIIQANLGISYHF